MRFAAAAALKKVARRETSGLERQINWRAEGARRLLCVHPVRELKSNRNPEVSPLATFSADLRCAMQSPMRNGIRDRSYPRHSKIVSAARVEAPSSPS